MGSTSNTNKPIVLITHPRACSTAFERILMTRRDVLNVLNEPFADPCFFGPEARSERHRVDGVNAVSPGYENCTYASRVADIERGNYAEEGKRAFFKDMAFQLAKPIFETQELAPSFHMAPNAEPDNPTAIPLGVLRTWQWTFLIRNPHHSIPSLYRLSTPDRRNATGWHYFLASEAGYKQLRSLLDYFIASKVIHPGDVCLIDADDLLNQPEQVTQAYCQYIGIDYRPEMLRWDSEEDDAQAAKVFATWTAFHMDALRSRGLNRKQAKAMSTEEENLAWQQEFGSEGAAAIRKTIEANMQDYEYLRTFRLKLTE